MSKEVKYQILSKVTTLLDKFSDRLVRIAEETRRNIDNINAQQERLAALANDIAKKVDKSDVLFLAGVIEGMKKELDKRATDLNFAHGRLDCQKLILDGVKAENATEKVQNDSAHLSLLERVKEVAFENNKREEAQTLRDQSNVQALTNLRDSTEKAFNQVAADVKSLLTTVQRLNERVGQVESQIALSKHLPLMKHQGYFVTFKGNQLFLSWGETREMFSFTEDIIRIKSEPYGLLVIVKSGDQFLIVGGPDLKNMYVMPYKTAAK
jgi:hypothetical protein